MRSVTNQIRGVASYPQLLQARRRSPHTCARASTETVQSTETQEDDEDDEDVDIQIEGLTEDYCDDFVCTSSPAVEQTLRSLAKDLVRRRWTPILFAKDVKYRVSARHVCMQLFLSSSWPCIDRRRDRCCISEPQVPMCRTLTGDSAGQSDTSGFCTSPTASGMLKWCGSATPR